MTDTNRDIYPLSLVQLTFQIELKLDYWPKKPKFGPLQGITNFGLLTQLFFITMFIIMILVICLFLFEQSSLLHSKPKSTVGTPAYIAPEVLSRKEYDGKVRLVFLPAWHDLKCDHLFTFIL